MYTTARQICYHIPRKCRSVLTILCLLIMGILLLVLLHLTAAVVGFAAHENHMTDDDIIAIIPREDNSKLLRRRSSLHELKQYDWIRNNLPLRNYSKHQTPLKNTKQEVSNHTSLQSTHHSLLCVTTSTNIIFFIRIPKCASTSFVDILKRLSSNGFFQLNFNPSGAYNWDFFTTRKVAKQVIEESKASQTGYIYARHFYYINFEKYQVKNFTYVTIIRDPVSRFVSSFLYYHFSSRPHIKAMLDSAHKNESIVECLQQGHEGCQVNLMTKYFCGHEVFCKEGSERALEQAKLNIERHFAVIGLVEDLTTTYRVLKNWYPKYFMMLSPEINSLEQKNKNENVLHVTNDTRHIIEEANRVDIILYQYAQKRLYDQALKCGI